MTLTIIWDLDEDETYHRANETTQAGVTQGLLYPRYMSRQPYLEARDTKG